MVAKVKNVTSVIKVNLIITSYLLLVIKQMKITLQTFKSIKIDFLKKIAKCLKVCEKCLLLEIPALLVQHVHPRYPYHDYFYSCLANQNQSF